MRNDKGSLSRVNFGSISSSKMNTNEIETFSNKQSFKEMFNEMSPAATSKNSECDDDAKISTIAVLKHLKTNLKARISL